MSRESKMYQHRGFVQLHLYRWLRWRWLSLSRYGRYFVVCSAERHFVVFAMGERGEENREPMVRVNINGKELCHKIYKIQTVVTVTKLSEL